MRILRIAKSHRYRKGQHIDILSKKYSLNIRRIPQHDNEAQHEKASEAETADELLGWAGTGAH